MTPISTSTNTAGPAIPVGFATAIVIAPNGKAAYVLDPGAEEIAAGG